MPGVPSSRGCDACRKQKKRCDQIKPACSRCQRLNITCTNAGTQRWKFQDQVMRRSGNATFSDAVYIRQTQASPIPATLDSEQSRVANALISIWKVDDLKYDISVYGDYFQFIPRRLGTSRALDAATWAFICAYPSLSTGQPSVEALAAYGKAINALGDALRNPAQRLEPNTLMALHLVQSVQCWVDKPTDHYANHPMVMAHLLPAMIAQEWKDPVDRLLLLITMTLIIVVATTSPNVPLPVEQMRLFFRKFLPPRPYSSRSGAPLETMSLDRLVDIPVWSRAPRKHALEMKNFYQEILLDLDALQTRAQLLIPSRSMDKDSDALTTEDARKTRTALTKLYVQLQVGCSLLLSVATFLNATLRAIEDPFDLDTELITVGDSLTESTLQLAEAMTPFLPLYASGVSMTLITAWGAERDPEKITRLADFQRIYNFPSIGERWLLGGMWIRGYLEKLREEAVALVMSNHENDDMETVSGRADAREVYADLDAEPQVNRCTIL